MAVRIEDMFLVSPADYLAGERATATKSEWVNGVVYNMAGASKRHVNTVMTLLAHLLARRNDHGCSIGASDLLVKTENAFYYPDIVVSCDPSDDEYVETQPCFIVEVLSPSTKRADRHEKRDAYLLIPTMLDYWIIDPENHVIEVWARIDGGWVGGHHTANDRLRVQCLDLELAVVDIVGS